MLIEGGIPNTSYCASDGIYVNELRAVAWEHSLSQGSKIFSWLGRDGAAGRASEAAGRASEVTRGPGGKCKVIVLNGGGFSCHMSPGMSSPKSHHHVTMSHMK